MMTIPSPARLAWHSLALICISLGVAGAVLPLLPTTPFLLVAAWAAPKGSPRLARWLSAHPRLGPPLRAWQVHRALPRRAKPVACGLLALSWSIVLLSGASPLLLALLGGLFIGVALFLLSRPTLPSR